VSERTEVLVASFTTLPCTSQCFGLPAFDSIQARPHLSPCIHAHQPPWISTLVHISLCRMGVLEGNYMLNVRALLLSRIPTPPSLHPPSRPATRNPLRTLLRSMILRSDDNSYGIPVTRKRKHGFQQELHTR
jgi:hypothetical protein